MGDLEALIPETQKLLGAIIQKPKLTENLLKKPPFRFLHDIVSEVKRQTGFPEDLTDHDLDSNNFKDKDSKVAYLNKIIGLVTGKVGAIAVKPQKIVAGLEPENTNALLIGLAKAAGGGGGGAAAPPPEKPKEKAPEKKAPPPEKKEEPKPPQEAPKPRPEAADEGGGDAEARPQKSRGERSKKPPAEPEPAPQPEPEPAPAPAPKKAPPPPQEPAREPPAEEDTGVSRRMDRPRTARRAPPKVQTNVGTHKDTRPGSKQSEKPGGGGARVIVEGEDGGDEDDEDDDGMLAAGPQGGLGNQRVSAVGADGDHGMLVKNMLAKEQDIVSKDAKKGRGEENNALLEGQKHKEREKTQEEMNKLKEAIQSLCQSTNPLARSMDYIQEDLDNMGKELDFWMKDKVLQTQLLEEEEKKTEQELEKLVNQLQAVEESIKEEELRINDMKGSVLRNDMTIKQMLGSVVRNTPAGR